MTTQIPAWSTPYKKGLSAPPNTRLAYAIVGIKNLLNHLGFNDGMNLTTPKCGAAFARSVKAFQLAHGLTADGIYGPISSKTAVKIIVAGVENTLLISGDLLCKDLGWESLFDPGAIYYNENNTVDRGLAQLNSATDVTVTDAEAFDSIFPVHYLGKRIANAAASYTACPAVAQGVYTADELAVMAHRSPEGADWVCDHPDTTPFNWEGKASTAEQWGQQVVYYIGEVKAVSC